MLIPGGSKFCVLKITVEQAESLNINKVLQQYFAVYHSTSTINVTQHHSQFEVVKIIDPATDNFI